MCNKQKWQESICSNTFLQFLVHLDSIQTFLLFMMFVNILWGIGADRMLLTDCYPLKLIGTANNTSRENETAAVSKAVAGAKFGSAFVARTSCFVHPEEQLRLQIKCLQITTQRKSSKKCCGQTCFSVRHHSLQSHYTVHSYIFGTEILLFLLI